MKKMLTENKDKGFGIVGISLDDNKEDWAACIQELQLTWPQMSDLKGGASTIAQSFGVRAIPFTVVVSQDGTILKKGLRGEELAAFVSEKLK
jgi:peroxiredoxin